MEDLDIFQTYGDLERELLTLKKKVEKESQNPYKNETREQELREQSDRLMVKHVEAQNKFQKEYEQYLILKTIMDFENAFEGLRLTMARLEERGANPRVRNFGESKPRGMSFLNTFKNKWGRIRSRSLGGKRKQKTKRQTR
jgi:hypothetical protein